jgi:hypothetical protein
MSTTMAIRLTIATVIAGLLVRGYLHFSGCEGMSARGRAMNKFSHWCRQSLGGTNIATTGVYNSSRSPETLPPSANASPGVFSTVATVNKSMNTAKFRYVVGEITANIAAWKKDNLLLGHLSGASDEILAIFLGSTQVVSVIINF